MARVVELNIKVKDAEVKQAEASLKRLKKASDDVGTSMNKLSQQDKLANFLKNGIGGGSKEATAALDGMTKATAGATEGMSGLATSGGPVALVIAGIAVATLAAAAVAYKLGEAVFGLAKHFADYATDVGLAAQETGLATDTISALKYEADATKTPFNNIVSAVNEFRKTIGQAAGGSDDARKKLNLLGIDGSKAMTDVDGAFKSAITTIVKLPPGIDQARAAYAAFGSEGYKLIPFFQSFHGNVDEAIKKAQELGIVISGKDVDAAKAFNRAYADMQKQIQSISQAFGREFLPIVVGALKDFGEWIGRNKKTISEWAVSTGNFVSGVIKAFETLIKFVNDHPIITKVILGVATQGGSEAIISGINGISAVGSLSGGGTGAGSLPRVFDYSRPQDFKTAPDSAALEAQRAQQEKALQEMIDRNKRDWDASIALLKDKGTEAVTGLRTTFAQVEEAFANSGNVENFKKNTEALLAYYQSQVLPIIRQLGILEDTKATRNKSTPNEMAFLHQEEIARATNFAQQETDIRAKADKLIEASQKKTSAENIRITEEEMRKKIELSATWLDNAIQDKQYEFQQGKIDERELLNFVGTTELEKLNLRKKYLKEFLLSATLDGKKQEQIIGDIKNTQAQADQQKKTNVRALTQEELQRLSVIVEIGRLEKENADADDVAARRQAAANSQRLSLMQQIAELGDAIATAGINDSLAVQAAHLRDVLDLRNRELDAVIAINRAQLALSQSMKISNNQIRASVYDHLAQQKTLNESIADGINQTYDTIAGKLDDQIDKMFKWAGAFKSLFTEPLKALAHNNLTNITKSLLDAFIPGLGTELTKTNNPIARPIVDKLDEIKKILQSSAGGAGSGGGLSLGSLLGGSAGGGIFNLGGSGAGGASGGRGIFGSGGLISRILGSRTGTVSGSGADDGRSIIGKLTGDGGLFGKGGIFGKQGFGNNAGTYSAISSITALVGSAIGGRVGSILSSVGTFAGIGTAILPGIGTAIGAAVGLIAGILGGDPNRKKDKKENIPALNKGFTDAFAELNSILADIRSLRIDPDEALKRASDVRGQIAGGFGVQFLSKKYRKQAQQMISTKLTEADTIIAQIKASAEIARGAADRNKRILPEFAGGTYFADYFKPNGLLPGMFDGRDNILAMISRGEMVLNPMQQNRIRAIAGGDVFAGAGIPNYPRPSSSAKLAGGGIAGSGLSMSSSPMVVQPNFTLFIEGVAMDEKVKAYLKSDDGKRTQVTLIKDLRKSGDIS